MIIYPAMDLMSGRCVRLAQGRFEEATVYAADPAEALAGFAAAGATWAHVVDLDGARVGAAVQHDLLARLAATAPLKLQVAGGFRSRGQVARMIDTGVGRVVIGSLAVRDPDGTRRLIEDFGAERITLALDVHFADGAPMVATAGWTQASGLSLYEVARLYPEALHLLVTDIGRDGMLRGPNLELAKAVLHSLPYLQLQSSGGIASPQDVEALAATDVAGVIVGKALWEGRIDLGEAIRIARA